MVCPKCGYQNHDDAAFCSGCGTKLEKQSDKKICKKCGYENKLDASFCGGCGTKLVRIPPRQPAKYLITAGLILLAVVFGVHMFRSAERKENPSDSGAVISVVPGEQHKDLPEKLPENRMKETGSGMKAIDSAEPYFDDLYAFDTDIPRDQVRSIVFLDTLDSVPQNAYDLSENADGSVMMWMGTEDDLYIAADGRIVAPGDCSGMFANYSALEEICFNGCLDTSEVTDMTGMFRNCGVSELDLRQFDTSNVKSMAWMFSQSYLRELDISSFDTGNVTDMRGMFSYCIELRELDLSSFDTSSVVDMSSMFERCLELEQLNVAGFHTASVENMEKMFYECGMLKQLDVSGFDTRRVRDMSDMFYWCCSLPSLDVSGFKTPAATDMSAMFCYLNVNYLDLRGFDFSNVTDASYMFFASEELWDVDINQINLPASANTEMMFEYCPAF